MDLGKNLISQPTSKNQLQNKLPETQIMKKNSTLITAIACIAALLIISPILVYSQNATMTSTNYSYYINSAGSLIVVGEVQNTGTQTIGSAVITGVVYTADGQIQAGTEYSLIYATEILPNQTAPFYMKFSDQDANYTKIDWTTIQIDHFQFNYVTNPNSTQQYSGLQIMADTSYVDSTGNYTVNGVVLNRGSLYPQNIWVVAAFYDSTGKVVATGYTNYLTHYLTPNEVAQFTITPNDAIPQTATQIASYKLQVLSSGTMDPTAPTPTPTSTPLATITPTNTPSSPATTTPAPSADQNVTIPITYLYVIIAALVAIVVIALAVILRRSSKK
jgi:hypothetical protein